MAITINTNIPAQQAQISLERAQNGLDTAMQRLATGYRINSAADDAAGLQISNRMTAQINGLTVAARNANDGISIAQTAEGAMSETTSLLQQMRDLAVQSASDSNSAADREALNGEVIQLVAELNRIASSTSFGGQNLLDGSFSTKNIQVGAYANEVIPITVMSTAGSELGILGTQLNFAGFTLGPPGPSTPEEPGGISSQNLKIGYNSSQTVVPIVAGASANEVVTAVSDAVPEVIGLANTSVTVDYSPMLQSFGGGDTLSIAVNGVNVISPNTALILEEAVAALAAGLQSNNIDAKSSAGLLVLTDPSGANMMISSSLQQAPAQDESLQTTPKPTTPEAVPEAAPKATPEAKLPSMKEGGSEQQSVAFKAGIYANSYDGTPPSSPPTGNLIAGTNYMATGSIQWIAVDPTATYTFESSGTMLGPEPGTEVKGTLGSAVDMSVNTLDISTYTGAQQAIGIIDHALADIDANRATLGAIQNRFQHTIYNLQNVRENMMASRSRIEDTDYASEMSTLTRDQVLKQASMASLNRANQMQQDVLTLIN